MDLKIPNIVKPIELKEYAPEFGEAKIYVWVNPPREMRLALINTIMTGEAKDEDIGEWFAKIWSEGPEDTHFTPDDVLKMAKESLDQDPQLWLWLMKRTTDLLVDHYGAKKKPLT